MNIRSIVQDSDTAAGRLFDKCVLVLILASLVSLSLSTFPDLPPRWRTILATVETVIIVLFTIEYALRIWTAEDRWGYVRSFYGVVDLLAVVPFFVTLLWPAMIDLRPVRAFACCASSACSGWCSTAPRWFDWARPSARARRSAGLPVRDPGPSLHRGHGHPLLRVRGPAGEVQVRVPQPLVGGRDPDDGGYGDAYPITLGGRIFTFLVLICGMGIVAVPAGLIASGMTRALEDERAARRNGPGAEDPSNG